MGSDTRQTLGRAIAANDTLLVEMAERLIAVLARWDMDAYYVLGKPRAARDRRRSPDGIGRGWKSDDAVATRFPFRADYDGAAWTRNGVKGVLGGARWAESRLEPGEHVGEGAEIAENVKLIRAINSLFRNFPLWVLLVSLPLTGLGRP